MRRLLADDPDGDKLKDYTKLLYGQAQLTAQLPLEDPLTFARLVSDLMTREA